MLWKGVGAFDRRTEVSFSAKSAVYRNPFPSCGCKLLHRPPGRPLQVLRPYVRRAPRCGAFREGGPRHREPPFHGITPQVLHGFSRIALDDRVGRLLDSLVLPVKAHLQLIVFHDVLYVPLTHQRDTVLRGVTVHDSHTQPLAVIRALAHRCVKTDLPTPPFWLATATNNSFSSFIPYKMLNTIVPETKNNTPIGWNALSWGAACVRQGLPPESYPPFALTK